MIRFSLLLAAFFCASSISFAQVPNAVTQSTQWGTLNSYFAVTKKVGFLTEINARYVGKFQPMQYEAIGGVNYILSRKFSFVPLGYAVVLNDRYGKQPSAFANNEYRFWQRVQYQQKIGRVPISHRIALEERSIQRHVAEGNAVLNEGYSNQQMRLRYRANAVLALGQQREAKFFYLNGWDELCYSWGKYVMHHTPNQNRLFLGVGYQISTSASIQTGYIYQWLKKDNGIQTENNMGVMVQFNYAFQVFKKELSK